jgi:hypothetical protein
MKCNERGGEGERERGGGREREDGEMGLPKVPVQGGDPILRLGFLPEELWSEVQIQA